MSEAVRYLMSLSNALATIALYGERHPATRRAIDRSFERLQDLQRLDPNPEFSFLGSENVYGEMALRDLRDWEWGTRLSNAGVQRIELGADVTLDDYEAFLREVLRRLSYLGSESAEARPAAQERIRFGAIGIKGIEKSLRELTEQVQIATIAYSLVDEVNAVRWIHDEVSHRGALPMAEAEAVVRSLAVGMHGASEMILPLLELREYDQYTTTHALNVSVLTMALAEHLGLGARDIRTFGIAGLLHDLGKVRVPKDILNKPGKLSDDERAVMQQHPADGARLIISSGRRLDVAATVAYEHHIMIDGGGYPHFHYRRDCHRSSQLVHVCDVYDALRTNRPYRPSWEAERVLAYIEERAGTEFEPDTARAFVRMMRALEGRLQVAPIES